MLNITMIIRNLGENIINCRYFLKFLLERNDDTKTYYRRNYTNPVISTPFLSNQHLSPYVSTFNIIIINFLHSY